MGTILVFLFAFVYCFEIAAIKNLPELRLSTPELIEYWGYPSETHKLVTEDGYILTLHRIPHGKTNPSSSKNLRREVFYLQHGLMCSSADWVINLPHQSLGFVLADRGFDVWLGNVRGNTYSREHIKLSTTTKEYWNFSFDEHAKYDFPATMKYILNETSSQQLYYVGHSQGTTMAFASLSEYMKNRAQVKMLFALAPISTINHINERVRKIASWEAVLRMVWSVFGVDKIFTGNTQICKFIPNLCHLFIRMVVGHDDDTHFNTTRSPVYRFHTPAGTSTKNILHWFQMINSKKFRKYDYGEIENVSRYNRKFPPLYHLGNISTKVVLVGGSRDTLASRKDVLRIGGHLPNFVKHFHVEGYGHADFVRATNAGELIYKIIDESLLLTRQ